MFQAVSVLAFFLTVIKCQESIFQFVVLQYVEEKYCIAGFTYLQNGEGQNFIFLFFTNWYYRDEYQLLQKN